MPEKRELHIHIGLGKTGTTGIQAGLLANRDALEAAGYTLAPMYDELGQHHPLARLLGQEGPEAVLRVLRGTDAPRLIISSELIAGRVLRNPDLLDGLAGGLTGGQTGGQTGGTEFRHRYYIMLRRIDAHLESGYAQVLRNYLSGMDKTRPTPIAARAEEAIRSGSYGMLVRLERALRRIVALHGPEALTASVYRETGPRDSFGVLLGQIGVPLDPATLVRPPPQNLSISRHRTRLLEGIEMPTPALRKRLLRQVMTSHWLRDDRERNMLPPETRRRLVEVSAPAFERMNDILRLAPEDLAALTTPGGAEPGWEPAAPAGPREVLRLMMSGWSDRMRPADKTAREPIVRGIGTEAVATAYMVPALARALVQRLRPGTRRQA